MFVIIISAALTFIITIILLLASVGRLPFLAKADRAISASQSDKKIYRQQMAEIENLQQQGLLDEASAKQARTELARQIIAAEKKMARKDEQDFVQQSNNADNVRQSQTSFRLILSIAILFIPLFVGVIYFLQGEPAEPDRPFAAFMKRNPVSLNPQEKIVRLEVLTARNPHNGQYADQLASAYLAAQLFQNAANAYNHAMVLNGENSERLLGYALALTGFEDGVVNQKAAEAFQNVLRLDPHNPQAQLFLARGLMQNGQKDEAIKLLKGYLQNTPQDSPWYKNLQTAISALEHPQTVKSPVNTSARLSPEQEKFIADNLDKLRQKLKQTPQDLQAWTMLINAYLVLGQQDMAQKVVNTASTTLSSMKAEQLQQFSRQKGLKIPQ